MAFLLHNSVWLVNLLDIASVALFIYFFLLLVRGTLTLRLILTLFIFFLVYLFSHLIGLKTLNWILDHILGSLVVLFAIIFQHDLRRALVAVSRKRAGAVHGKGEDGEVIEELVSAAEVLSKKRVGGLVVVERDMSLDSFLAVGTEIDAKVTSELITSIFLPYSPIHDGAVIIQKGKLTRAGCFLPLTQNPEISKTLGTRHRAAIGLSEVVDAVVIVVSEETGNVSVAAGGGIMRDLEPVALRNVLKRLLESRRLK